MPDIKEIKYFLAVAENGSISKAAEALFISQPSLSKYISKIEQEMGVPLFVRDHGGIRLTEAGEIYAHRAEEIRRISEELDAEIRNIKNRNENRIRVCMALNAVSFSADLLQKRLRTRYPQTELELVNLMAKDIPAALKRREYGFGIGPAMGKDDAIDYRFLAEEYLLLAMPVEYPEPKCTELREGLPYPWLDMKKLSPMDFVLQEKGTSIYPLVKKLFTESGYRPRKGSLMANSMVVIGAAEKGMGCCFISQTFMSYVHDKNRFRFYCVGEDTVKTISGLMILRDTNLSAQEKYCIELIRELLQQDIQYVQ